MKVKVYKTMKYENIPDSAKDDLTRSLPLLHSVIHKMENLTNKPEEASEEIAQAREVLSTFMDKLEDAHHMLLTYLQIKTHEQKQEIEETWQHREPEDGE